VVCAEPQTAFRRWSKTDFCDREVVIGLRAILVNVGLASYISAAEAWCLKVGAAFLGEVLDEFVPLCEALGFLGEGASRSQCDRLRSALVAQLEGHDQGGCADSFGAECRFVMRCSDMRCRPEEIAAPPTATEKCLRSFSTDAMSAEEPVPGMRGAFEEAGMGCHVDVAEQWCSRVGAAFLPELVEDIQALCDELACNFPGGVTLAQRSRLCEALVAWSSESCSNSSGASTADPDADVDPLQDLSSDDEDGCGRDAIGALHPELPGSDAAQLRRSDSTQFAMYVASPSRYCDDDSASGLPLAGGKGRRPCSSLKSLLRSTSTQQFSDADSPICHHEVWKQQGFPLVLPPHFADRL